MLATFLNSLILFGTKVLSNMLGTSKTILVQRNKALLAGIALGFSDLIYLLILKNVVSDDNLISTIVVSIASSTGCYLAIKLCNKWSKDRLYINTILCSDKKAIKDFSSYLTANKIVNVVSDSYDKDLQNKTLTITCYAETKAQSIAINKYIDNSPLKFKRVLYK